MSPQEGAFVIIMQTNQICKFNFLDPYSLVVVFEHWQGLTTLNTWVIWSENRATKNCDYSHKCSSATTNIHFRLKVYHLYHFMQLVQMFVAKPLRNSINKASHNIDKKMFVFMSFCPSVLLPFCPSALLSFCLSVLVHLSSLEVGPYHMGLD